MQRGGFVYILTSKTNTVLYTGVTSNLVVRIHQHLQKDIRQSFTSRYNVFKLVYFCAYPTINEAIAEEKRIKAGSRKKKIDLIESINSSWEDLWEKEVSKWSTVL